MSNKLRRPAAPSPRPPRGSLAEAGFPTHEELAARAARKSAAEIAELRDRFASAAMQGVLSNHGETEFGIDFEYVAKTAYGVADAMLEARAKR